MRKQRKDRFAWFDIMITLLALELMSSFYYGTRALFTAFLCVISAAAAEFISIRIMRKKFTADDLTCTSDGLILSLMLPAFIDYNIAVLASVFMITAAKCVFGGRRNMIFSPAAVGYVFILTSWSKKLLSYPLPHERCGIFEEPSELTESASHLFDLNGKLEYSDFELLLGNFSGPSGSVSVLLLIVAALILILRRDISAGAFIGSVLGTAIPAIIAPVSYSRVDSVRYSLIMNMVLFASIYIIADRRIAPRKNYYAFFYGFFIAAFAYIITITTAKENAIVMISVLFTPIALMLRELERGIEHIRKTDIKARADEDGGAAVSVSEPADDAGSEAKTDE